MNKDLPQLITYNSIQPFEGKSITVNEKEALNIFPVKRIYWIKYFADEITYSEHAHKSLRQIIIAIEGKVDIQLKASMRQRIILRWMTVRKVYIFHLCSGKN